MKQGFTMVELSLSMILISVLSIIMVLTISNAVSSYHKGLTLNQLNTVGMGVVDKMRESVQGSPGRFTAASDCQSTYNTDASTCINDKALSFVTMKRYANVKVGNNTVNVPVYGAFCTGAYSFIWNSGYFFNSNDYAPQGVSRAIFKFRDDSGQTVTREDFKLLKVADDERAVCKAAAGAISGDYTTSSQFVSGLSNVFDVTCSNVSVDKRPTDICGAIDPNTVDTDLIDNNGSLALYDLSVAPPAESVGTNNMFYAVSFILGTVQGGINVSSTSGNYCVTPEDYSNSEIENFDYCAINKFNFAAQATGG